MNKPSLELSESLAVQRHRLEALVKGRDLPSFITIEGPIGVGKTTLARHLASAFEYDVLLERAQENPFLGSFYKNRRQNALATQLFFLFQRAQQIQEMRQQDMFAPVRVADFLIEKDRLFAKVNLDENEFSLYEQVYAQLTIDAPKPDLVIYLQAPVDVLMQRIAERGLGIERNIDSEYIELLNQAYSEFFLYYDDAPLLIVNCSDIDFNANADDFLALVDYMLNIRGGRHYFNPTIFS
ncbi:MAG: deoxynucleoside kinase [Gammaproteobacteria bacterium]|nr:deoxynucleoside kinase [Gammaproteobacteria bacterium]NNM11052.1 deoxynucleoside kinase [Pseudomonadales bacterium]